MMSSIWGNIKKNNESKKRKGKKKREEYKTKNKWRIIKRKKGI